MFGKTERRGDDLVLQSPSDHLENLKFPFGQLAHLIETAIAARLKAPASGPLSKALRMGLKHGQRKILSATKHEPDDGKPDIKFQIHRQHTAHDFRIEDLLDGNGTSCCTFRTHRCCRMKPHEIGGMVADPVQEFSVDKYQANWCSNVAHAASRLVACSTAMREIPSRLRIQAFGKLSAEETVSKNLRAQLLRHRYLGPSVRSHDRFQLDMVPPHLDRLSTVWSLFLLLRYRRPLHVPQNRS